VGTQNQFRLLEQYQLAEATIKGLLESMMTSLNGIALLRDEAAQQDAIHQLSRAYPFVELLYSLDKDGIQELDSAYSRQVSARKRRLHSKGSDRSQRPYFKAAQENQVVVTQPYLSTATHELSLSAVQHFVDADGNDLGYLVLNFNLQRLISYLNGDETRARLHPWFQWVYCGISTLLLLVSAVLLYSAVDALLAVFASETPAASGAFGIVILTTLGMSIFDLGKTILEEEVLVSKDNRHHLSSQRTISRFMTTIIIAISIEALLLIFRALLEVPSDTEQLYSAVWILLSAVAMMVGLGIYLRLSQSAVRRDRQG